ncbi:hypothetical protein C5612_25860 [Pseudomonas frederiksbergensis]|uniref:Uncharacterized protein n=1 Tax=Pseudomonas frederiksbergensis TaxID=104087 RepID=A0A2S8HB06_9PSED|nr:hypothetical protein C5612_25860 [Pseudomonas frederiksbergensis]
MNPVDAVCLMHRKFWFDDCCAAERSLAGSAAATGERGLGSGYRAECSLWQMTKQCVNGVKQGGGAPGSQRSDCPDCGLVKPQAES